MNKISLFLLGIYKRISALFPHQCVYIPNCSEYARAAFTKYSFLKAIGLVFWRLLRCNPLSRGGLDNLP